MTHPPVTHPPVTHPPVTLRSGWWRRNWWGLVLLPVALAVALIPSVRDGYGPFWKNRPHLPSTGTPGGWVQLGGARMRVRELAVRTDLRGYGGRPVTLPDQVRAWRATIEFAAPRQDAVRGCAIALEARGGRTYSADPVELSDLDLPIAGCTAPDPPGAPPAAYQIVVFFVLPRVAAAAAVRISLPAQLPRYARMLPP